MYRLPQGTQLLHVVSKVIISPDNTVIHGRPWSELKFKLNEDDFDFADFRENIDEFDFKLCTLLDKAQREQGDYEAIRAPLSKLYAKYPEW